MSTTRLRACLILIGLGFVAACNSLPPPPKTYPVKGKIVFIEGGSPSEGTVEFQSATVPVRATGKVGADGTFTLITQASNTSVEGAVEGEHTVTFISGVGGKEDGQSPLRPSTAKEKYTVKADGENNFTIKLAKPRAPGN